jgi:hypothetical protein
VSADQAQAAQSQQQGDWQSPGAVRPCSQKCWIEVQLLDNDDQPVPREPYWIKLPDGSIRQGKLNDQGSIRFDGIPCGTCTVRWPNFDGQFVASSRTYTPQNKAWLELVLLTDDDEPVPGESYSVTLSDGSVQSGKLNGKGRARLEGLPSGTCTVSFPDIAKDDLLSHTNG